MNYVMKMIVRQMVVILIAAAIGVFVVMWALGGDDISDQQSLYCANVKDQTWPDYAKSFEKSCKEVLTEAKK